MEEELLEQIVSYDVAKVLAAKGFDLICRMFYPIDNYEAFEPISPSNFNDKNVFDGTISAPTLTQAQAWLRTKKIEVISNFYVNERKGLTYQYLVSKIRSFEGEYAHQPMDNGSEYNTYESALSIAIEKSLQYI